ncbi:glycoside hydrolase superfamily [Massariosphaeria phaeospora]|uniref:Glycoside hydrolase superfamily n=1 Tax=Massariosphaeria phaeospora TaxID=100035 RepID=A0A7C8MFN3_9PLEO|nr:glycoside hydrolase superfamily [Massariosphaeria phaeospora]
MGDGLETSNPTVGDMHQWNVWHSTQEKHQIFDTLGGRFHSQFGTEAFPHIDTISSHMLDFHNQADGHKRRIATYLVENFRTQTDLEAFIHLTQLSQAEALMFGYRGWRRQWGQQQVCGGALVWQLNDCWPPAYYAMRRVLAPVAVAVKRAHHDWSVVHARVLTISEYEVWVASSSQPTEVAATVELRFSSRQGSGSTGTVRWSRDVDWPQPLEYLSFEDRGVEVQPSGKTIVVSARKPKGLVFEERSGLFVHDSAIDVVPGDEQARREAGIAHENGLQRGGGAWDEAGVLLDGRRTGGGCAAC